jgi:hypothetical protein
VRAGPCPCRADGRECTARGRPRPVQAMDSDREPLPVLAPRLRLLRSSPGALPPRRRSMDLRAAMELRASLAAAGPGSRPGTAGPVPTPPLPSMRPASPAGPPPPLRPPSSDGRALLTSSASGRRLGATAAPLLPPPGTAPATAASAGAAAQQLEAQVRQPRPLLPSGTPLQQSRPAACSLPSHGLCASVSHRIALQPGVTPRCTLRCGGAAGGHGRGHARGPRGGATGARGRRHAEPGAAARSHRAMHSRIRTATQQHGHTATLEKAPAPAGSGAEPTANRAADGFWPLMSAGLAKRTQQPRSLRCKPSCQALALGVGPYWPHHGWLCSPCITQVSML